MVAFNPGMVPSSNPAYNPGGMPVFDGETFLPNSISNLQLWLDAADSSTITESSGSVSQWDDKSGSGNNATQGTGSKQPTTNSETRNGHNVFVFDNNDTFVLSSGIFSIPNGSNTTFVVVKHDVASGVTDNILHLSESGSGRYFMRYESTAGELRFQSRAADSGGVTVAEITGITQTNFNILTATRSGTAQIFSANGGTEVTSLFGADESGIDAAFIGSRVDTDGFLDGSLAEIIIYDRLLSTSEISLVENYLSNKWAVALS